MATVCAATVVTEPPVIGSTRRSHCGRRETTLRTYGAKSDAYAVFRKMLDKGNPPDSWDALLTAARDASARERLEVASPDTP